VLRGEEREAVLWNGPVLELERGATARLGPDIVGDEVEHARFRRVDQGREIGEALLDQGLVAGIGNLWRAEGLWHARVSPWRSVGELSDEELRDVLERTARLMRASVEGARNRRAVYRRPGRPCPRCGTAIRSRGQGDDNRIAYWCPGCQH
jgi:endonuclease-8